MSDLVGRFLSFEEHLGKGLVKFVYYVLLFLLVVATLFDLGEAVFRMITVKFWTNMWQFLVIIPLRSFVALLLLRVGAELAIAVLSIDDNLKGEGPGDDVMSTGLNPVTPPTPTPTVTQPRTAAPEPEEESGESTSGPAKRATKKKAAKKAARKASKKTAPDPEARSSGPETGTES